MPRLLIGAMFFITIIGSGNVLSAQNLNISPNDTIELTGTMEDVETLTISFQNTGSSPLVLKWKKVSVVVPDYWEAQVCDNKICYSGLEDSGTMNPVDSSESAFLLLHITSRVNYGTAIVRYVVWDEQYPLIKDSLTYILHVEAVTGTRNSDEGPYVRVFPNPGKGYIHIHTNRQNGFLYLIEDITGKSIARGYSESGNMTLLTTGFKPGLYYLRLPDEKGQIRTIKFIITY